MDIILLSLAGIFLLIAAYQDAKHQEVLDLVTGGFTLCCGWLAHLNGQSTLALVAVSLCLFFLAIPDLPCFGGADGAMLAGYLALLSWHLPIFVATFSTLALLFYTLDKRGFHTKLIQNGRFSLVTIMAITTPAMFAVFI